MPDDAPPPQPSLLERWTARYQQIRANDAVVRKYQRFIDRDTEAIHNAKRRISVARSAIRTQERWLKGEATDLVAQEAGIKAIPGFGHREDARAVRLRISEQIRAAKQQGSAQLQPP